MDKLPTQHLPLGPSDKTRDTTTAASPMTPACMSSRALGVEARDSGCKGAYKAEFVLLQRHKLLLSLPAFGSWLYCFHHWRKVFD